MSHYNVAEIYTGLRNNVLSLDPAQIGLSEAGLENPIFAMLMEIGYESAVATLVLVADGTVSLYFSNGGGQIGSGEHEIVRQAAADCLSLGADFMQECEKTEEYPLPGSGNIRFYLLTFQGTLTAEARGDDLGNNHHPLSPLFHAAHRVITAIRMLREGEE